MNVLTTSLLTTVAVPTMARPVVPVRLTRVVPPVFATRVLSLRGFGEDGMMIDAMLAQRGEADAAIRRLFDDPAIAIIHAHNATRGCFSARIERK